MSISLRTGAIGPLIFLVIATAIVLYYLWSAMQGKPQPLRSMPAVEAISDGVDRAVEEGKPVYISAGDLAYLSGMYAPMTINGMNILRYTARLCIQKGAKIIIPSPYVPEALPLIDGIYREVCVSEGKPEAYNRDNVRYYGNREMSWYVGAIQDVLSTGCSLLVLVGALSSAGIYIAGAALDDGAMVIAGTPRYAHQASWAAMADYPLFCEDIYAAGALCSGDPGVASSQVGGDLVKLILIGITLVFAVIAAAGLPVATKGGWLFQ